MSNRTISDGTEDKAYTATELNGSRTPIDLIDVFLILKRRWRFLFVVTLASLLIGVAVANLIRPYFTSAAVVLPPQEQTSIAASLIGQLGSLAPLAGGSSLGLKSSSEMYVGFLKSRTIADRIIKQFDLAKVYGAKDMVDLRRALATHSDIEAGKDGLIRISVTDHDPNRASQIANAYVSGLYELNGTLATTEAAQRRVFFDRQLQEEKKALTDAEDALRNTEHRTGVIQLGSQTQALLLNMANLRAQLSSAEVQLQGLRTYATDQNPEVLLSEHKIATLRSQIASLESNQGQQSDSGDISLSAGRTPEDSLEYTRKLREVKYHDALYDLLSKQQEAARIDEAKSAPLLQLVDSAVAPDKKSGPSRSIISLAFAFVGLICAAIWILLRSSLLTLQWSQLTRERSKRVDQLIRGYDRVVET